MKLKNGLKSKKERCFKVTEGTKYFLSTLEVMLPCTLGVRWLLHFPHSSTIAYRAMGTIRYSWIVMAILALWSWISREYKRTILRINNEGVAFYKKEYFYEYEWNEIEYIHQSNTLGRLQLYIKVFGKEQEYMVDLDGCMLTYIPIRLAVRHYSKGRIKYYTWHQWKKHNNSQIPNK